MFRTETTKDKKTPLNAVKFKITEPHLIKMKYFILFQC